MEEEGEGVVRGGRRRGTTEGDGVEAEAEEAEGEEVEEEEEGTERIRLYPPPP